MAVSLLLLPPSFFPSSRPMQCMSTSTVNASAAAAAAAAAATLWLVPLWYQSMMDRPKREYRLTGVERVLCTNWQIAKIIQAVMAHFHSENECNFPDFNSLCTSSIKYVCDTRRNRYLLIFTTLLRRRKKIRKRALAILVLLSSQPNSVPASWMHLGWPTK